MLKDVKFHSRKILIIIGKIIGKIIEKIFWIITQKFLLCDKVSQVEFCNTVLGIANDGLREIFWDITRCRVVITITTRHRVISQKNAIS
jgi:hypothetical protein